MRTILFKGKRKDNNEWIEGNLFQNDIENNYAEITGYDFNTYYNPYIDSYYEYEIDLETICQCTGMDDGDEDIWENDIYTISRKGENYDCIVEFIDGCFWFIPIGDDGDAMTLYDAFENGFCCFKLGNKFDNPELLEKENKNEY